MPPPRNSQLATRSSSPRRAFTLIDLLLAACLLVILLSLAVSMSRHVRAQSAAALTNEVLARLERLADQYAQLNHGQLPPAAPMPSLVFTKPHPSPTQVPPSPPQAQLSPPTPSTHATPPATQPDPPDPGTLDDRAARLVADRNNREFVHALLTSLGSSAETTLSTLPLAVFDPSSQIVRDAWGTPIAFLPRHNPAFGMAPRDAPFFVSAGPDRKFSTKADNLYSYEVLGR